MLIVQTIILPLLCLAPFGVAKLRRQGWLGRLVAYHKKNFIEDLARLPLPITVTLEKAPANYVDHPGWDFEAVLRLVLLIEVLGVEPARQAVHFAMAPSRRHYLPFGVDTYQLFPSWSEFSVVNENNDTMSLAGVDAKYGLQPFDEDTVVYIDNPLEARLPSTRITIKKMREVMEQEALERRNMATTTTPGPTYSFTHSPSTAKRPTPKNTTAAGPTSEPPSNTTQEESGATNATENTTTGATSGAATNTTDPKGDAGEGKGEESSQKPPSGEEDKQVSTSTTEAAGSGQKN